VARISGWAVLDQLRKVALGIGRRRQKAAGFGLFLSARRWEPELGWLPPEEWSRGGRRGLNLLHERRDGSLEPAELAVKLFDHFRGPLADWEGAANYPRDLDLAGRGPALHFQLVSLHRCGGDKHLDARASHPALEPFGRKHGGPKNGVEGQLILLRELLDERLHFVADIRVDPAGDGFVVAVFHFVLCFCFLMSAACAHKLLTWLGGPWPKVVLPAAGTVSATG
jgi:hypothetical protein